MSGSAPAPPGPLPNPPPGPGLPQAQVRRRRGGGFQAVWLVPIIAALIAGWLVWHNLSGRGPRIVINFRTGQGITADQTQIRFKSVQLGTVRSVRLSPDLSHVEVRADMLASAERMLTSQARFWVVRPRLTAGNISGLETVFSGAYIEMDPGQPVGPEQTSFTGLEDPPAIRSGEPGTAYTLTASRVGSLGSGSPIFFHDIDAGEVLNYDLQPSGDSVKLHVFVRAPFDTYVRSVTHFWNTSGIAVNLGAEGVQLRVSSLQAAISGGIAFDDGAGLRGTRSPPGATFPLYDDEEAAQNAGYSTQVKIVTYFDGSVRGLSPGAPVELNGIQVGTVTRIHLLFDPNSGTPSRVAVHMEVQPERFMSRDQVRTGHTLQIAQALVRHGLRAQLSTANFITGQLLVSFQFVPDTGPAEAKMNGDEVVLPGISGGLDSLTSNLSAIAQKLRSLPLDQVSQNLSEALHGISVLVNGPELRQALANLSAASRSLPGVAHQLDSTLAQTSKLVGSANRGYGDGSEFRRDMQRVLEQASDALRSVRLLADYLSIHPEALIRGRVGQAGNP